MPVPGMERVRRIQLQDPTNWALLVLEPGEPESLSVEGPPDVIRRVRAKVNGETLVIDLGGGLGERVRDALTTSLTRQHVTYRVRALHLAEVRVRGLVSVDAGAFGTDAPRVTRLEPTPTAPPPPPARG